MESAIKTIVCTYLKSAKGKDSLGPNDFQKLVKTKLSGILTDTDSKEAVKEMTQGLDANKDGKVGFGEYMNLIEYVAKAMNSQNNTCDEKPSAEGEQQEAS